MQDPIRPATGWALMVSVPASPMVSTYEPSASVVARPTAWPLASVATMTAPATGRGAHDGSGGPCWTGQTGPAVTVPVTLLPPAGVTTVVGVAVPRGELQATSSTPSSLGWATVPQ